MQKVSTTPIRWILQKTIRRSAINQHFEKKSLPIGGISYFCTVKIPAYISEHDLDRLIDAAVGEDVGDGDHTTLAAIPAEAMNKARLIAKEKGVVAGVFVANKVFAHIDARLKLDILLPDGSYVNPGDVIFTISGSARAILTSERLALNFMQRMSGIASYTKKLNDLISGSNAKLLDTRKTTPGMRMLEKWAVKIGGGENHRFGLFDMILLKDNHIDFAGGIANAIATAKRYLSDQNKNLKIEVETRSIDEVRQALATHGADVIMLDNMSPSQMKEAVKVIAGRCKTEASGNVTENNIREIADCGVDYISVGALTHSVKSLDLSLKALT